MAFTLILDACAILIGSYIGNSLNTVSGVFPEIGHFRLSYMLINLGGLVLSLILIFNIYRSSFQVNLGRQYFLAGRAYQYSTFLLIAAIWFYMFEPHNRRFVAVFFGTSTAIFLLGRYILNRLNFLFKSQGFGVHPVLIVGFKPSDIRLFDRFKGFPELGYKILGLVQSSVFTVDRPDAEDYAQYPIYEWSRIDDIVRRERIEVLFTTSMNFADPMFDEMLRVCKEHNIQLRLLSPEADQLLERARIFDIAGVAVFTPRHRLSRIFTKAVKRCLDIAGSLFLIFMLSPIFIVTTAAIILESGFPIIFRQRRASIKDGKSFDFLKFRSMVKDAEALKATLLDKNESTGALFKMRNDPRITRVGRFIRKYSIDELPQLFNVLGGDMSLVGPRPMPLKDFDQITQPDHFWASIRDRANTKPGMTGLWQISGRSNLGFFEMVLLDLYYVEKQTIIFDLEILFETIPVVLFSKGAY